MTREQEMSEYIKSLGPAKIEQLIKDNTRLTREKEALRVTLEAALSDHRTAVRQLELARSEIKALKATRASVRPSK